LRNTGQFVLAAQDSVVSQIARPYAQALFDVAKGDGSLGPVEQSLQSLLLLASESEDFSRFLNSPVISSEAKASAMDRILASSDVLPVVANFVRVIARNGRLFALPAIIKGFRELAAKERGEVTADVTSATPLSVSQLTALADTLREKIGKTVTLNQHVDPSLIGGLVVKVGSRMIDSSLKTKLAAMKIAMKEVG
jgi:F-type H+-transporting ATPase subunit delta